ncbi:MAG: hypothetical protein AABZ27_06645, partial [Candidatus Omnitrophota bacterium]
NSTIDFVTAKYKLEALYPPPEVESPVKETGDKIKDVIMPLEQKISLLSYEISILKERIGVIESPRAEASQKQKQK